MGAIPNLSSVLLFIPLLQHYHELSFYENLSLISFAVTSFLFHSSREHDIATTGDLSVRTYYLYKLDHLHIQLGLAYILARHYIPHHPFLYAMFIMLVIANDIINIDHSANKLTAILIAINLVRTIYMSTNISETVVIILACLLIAKGSFKGSEALPPDADGIYSEWTEWDKCKWHLSMGIVISMMIGNMICMNR